ncbi:MAG: hypothetical protein IKG87_10025 [Clostridia bacterium]|nr:hypothetical protein [Clostridia bacterium]
MGKIYIETTIESKYPVTISFTCGKCNKDVEYQTDIYLEKKISGSVSKPDAQILAPTPADSGDQIELIANFAKKNTYLKTYSDIFRSANNRPSVSYTCPYCHTIQIPNAGGELKTSMGGMLAEPGFKRTGMILILVWFILCIIFTFNDFYWGLLFATLAVIAGYYILYRHFKSQANKALADPDYLYSQYKSVLNPEVYVDFTPYGYGKVMANSEKYVKNMKEFKQKQQEKMNQ